MASEISQTEGRLLYYVTNIMNKIVKVIEAEGELVIARDWAKGKTERC